MRTKVLIIVVALVLAGIAAVLAARYVNSARTEVASDSRPVEVLVAQEDIPRGMAAEELISKKMIALEEVPQRFVAAGAISTARAIEGQVLSAPLTKGEQVTSARFELPAAAGLAFSVPKDQVAIAIPVDAVRGISQLVRPGDRVTVFATFEPGPNGTEDLTKMLLKEAKVVAVGGNLSAQEAAEQQDQSEDGKSGALASKQQQRAGAAEGHDACCRARSGREARLRGRDREGVGGASAGHSRLGPGRARSDAQDRLQVGAADMTSILVCDAQSEFARTIANAVACIDEHAGALPRRDGRGDQARARRQLRAAGRRAERRRSRSVRRRSAASATPAARLR